MKIGQLIECNVRRIVFKNHTENETETRPNLFAFEKALYEVKASVQDLVSVCFGSPELHTIKTSCITFQTADPDILLILFF